MARSISYNMNRQQRPRQDRRNGGRNSRSTPPQSNVPTIRQVLPGSTVSIVLKADQQTGNEVQGVVQDLLTRGDHPRGIKVRLQDGRIGRVQRMASGTTSMAATVNSVPASGSTIRSGARMPRDVRLDEPELPPARTFADYLPAELREEQAPRGKEDSTGEPLQIAKCPFCDFTGDETAVSHHVDEHLE